MLDLRHMEHPKQDSQGRIARAMSAPLISGQRLRVKRDPTMRGHSSRQIELRPLEPKPMASQICTERQGLPPCTVLPASRPRVNMPCRDTPC